MTCCDHEKEEKEEVTCGQFLDCESVCSKGKSVCPTGICMKDRYYCDPFGDKNPVNPDPEISNCDCTKQLPSDSDLLNCCLASKECRELKKGACNRQFKAFSGNVFSHIHTLTQQCYCTLKVIDLAVFERGFLRST